MQERPLRGLVARPSLIEVLEYREQVDARMAGRFEAGDLDEEAARVVLFGTHHEKQHQELLLTDIKHALWCNLLGPEYRDDITRRPGNTAPLRWSARADVGAENGRARRHRAERSPSDQQSTQHPGRVTHQGPHKRPEGK